MAASSLTIGSPIGPVRLVAEDGAVVAVEMEGEWEGEERELHFDFGASQAGACPEPFDSAPSALRSGQAESKGSVRTGNVRPAAPPADPLLATAAEQLAAWFAGRLRTFDLPLRPRGTAFQRAVWRELVRIPFGETRTYGDIATALGRPSATRAVGAANGRNPIAIVVPCHRVIGASGALTGYAGGLARKRWLLDHERAVLAR